MKAASGSSARPEEMANGGKEERGTDSNPPVRNHMEDPRNEVWDHQQCENDRNVSHV
jgi:hypothetical protein